MRHDYGDKKIGRKNSEKNGTPLRKGFVNESVLHPLIKDGMGAIQKGHKNYFDEKIRDKFLDSIEFDEAVKKGREGENRWDYFLGHESSGEIVGVEPHSAKQDEITTVIRKRKAAKDHLVPHLKVGVNIKKWLWVASGKVHFVSTEKAQKILDQNGIEFVGKKVDEKHLPKSK